MFDYGCGPKAFRNPQLLSEGCANRFAATTAPVVTSNTPVATPDKATTALKMAPKAKHHGHVKKDRANAKAPS